MSVFVTLSAHSDNISNGGYFTSGLVSQEEYLNMRLFSNSINGKFDYLVDVNSYAHSLELYLNNATTDSHEIKLLIATFGKRMVVGHDLIKLALLYQNKL